MSGLRSLLAAPGAVYLHLGLDTLVNLQVPKEKSNTTSHHPLAGESMGMPSVFCRDGLSQVCTILPHSTEPQRA